MSQRWLRRFEEGSHFLKIRNSETYSKRRQYLWNEECQSRFPYPEWTPIIIWRWRRKQGISQSRKRRAISSSLAWRNQLRFSISRMGVPPLPIYRLQNRSERCQCLQRRQRTRGCLCWRARGAGVGRENRDPEIKWWVGAALGWGWLIQRSSALLESTTRVFIFFESQQRRGNRALRRESTSSRMRTYSSKAILITCFESTSR